MPAYTKVVLVTGASSGIGKATVTRLASRGYRVFAASRRLETAQSDASVEAVRMDVSDNDSVVAAVEEVIACAGRIDALVNNAGSSILGAVEETTLDQARSLFETNFFGMLRTSHAVLPYMRARGSGRIVNVSSVLGFLPAPYMGVYAASKHAVEGLSESMDHEVRSFGVRVVVVEPGFTRTNIGVASPRGASPVEDYETQRERVVANIGRQIAEAPSASSVAVTVERAINAPGFARLTVGSQAGMLSALRRWMPSGLMDGALRKSFSLDA